jgi:voltage-gated potassium channel
VDERSERLQRRFELPILIAALLVIPVIAVEESSPGDPWEAIAAVANWAIWLLFLAEVLTMLSIVPDRRAWLRANALDVAIVVLTPPLLPPSMQAARVFRVARLLRLARGFVAMRRLFTPEGVRYAAITTAFIVVTAGAAFAAIEQDHQDEQLSAWDGIYWALSTITTVGYGDISPVTEGGRILAGAVMLAGIGFVAILTGAVAERFVASSREVVREERRLADEVADLRARIEQLER